jgi:DNA-binding PucR family transcriptional regulator
VAWRSPHTVVRYADVALLAAMLQDDLLADSLRQLYLTPLEDERDGGAALRETLRAYLATGSSISSAAMKLKVNRRTVRNRLVKVEEKVGRPLHTALADLETALRLQEFDASRATPRIESPSRN